MSKKIKMILWAILLCVAGIFVYVVSIPKGEYS